MAFHRELIDGKRLVLGMVPGNFERLVAGDTIDFEVDGLVVTLTYGRNPIQAREAVDRVKAATQGDAA